jgi:hypothetical protein
MYSEIAKQSSEELPLEIEAEAYTITPVSVWLRGAISLMLLLLGIMISVNWLTVQANKGSLLPYAIFPFAGIALTLWGSWHIWTRTHRREYTTVRVSRDMAPAKKSVKKITVIMLIAVAFVWVGQYSTGMLASSWWIVLWALLPYGAYTLAVLGFRNQNVPTKAALIAMARDHALAQETALAGGSPWEKRLQTLWEIWPIRYALGGLLFYFAYEAAQADPISKNDWIIIVILSIFAIGTMKEVFLWVICAAVIGGICYAFFGILAALPVSAAIIIGALIIANSGKQ